MTYHVRDIKRRSTSLFDTHISDQLLADENCLSELGVTGIIKLDSIQETNTDCIFPTPSPTTCHLSLLDSKCNPTTGNQDKVSYYLHSCYVVYVKYERYLLSHVKCLLFIWWLRMVLWLVFLVSYQVTKK